MQPEPEGWCRLKELPPIYQEAFRSGNLQDSQFQTFPIYLDFGWRNLLSVGYVFFLMIWLPLLHPAYWATFQRILTGGSAGDIFFLAIFLAFNLVGLYGLSSIFEFKRMIDEHNARAEGRCHFAALIGPHDLAIRPINRSWWGHEVLYFQHHQLLAFQIQTSGSKRGSTAYLWIEYETAAGKPKTIFTDAFMFGPAAQSEPVVEQIYSLATGNKT